jgi:WD40 repeat protein/serine/threonine protein kinase
VSHPPSAHQPETGSGGQLELVIARFLEAVSRGEEPDRQQLLEQNPAIAGELRSFLTDHDRLRNLADPLREGQTIPLSSVSSASGPGSAGGPASATTPPANAKQAGPPLGTRLGYFGQYELLREIARGGMGVVYQARQIKLNRVVALKMILAGQLASAEDVRRFHTEAEAAARLDHPGIVPIFEVGEHQGQHFFSMGYVDGPSLASRLADGPLAPRDAAWLLRAIAQAVQYAHTRGVVHRDLKPANVLLEGAWDQPSAPKRAANSAASGSTAHHTHLPMPRITDFGLAKQTHADSGQTRSGAIMGTPSYMAPEQAAGQIDQVREPADVYGLGAILYAMLTGRPPFQADNTLDTLMQVLEREPAAPSQLNPSVPADLQTICLKCLEKDRRRRYPTAQALADDLERFLNGEPILARPAGSIERLLKWSRRRPASAALVAVSLLATLLLAGGAAWFVNRLARERNDALQARNEALAARNEESVQRAKAEQAARDEAHARQHADIERQNAEAARTLAEKERTEANIQRRLAVDRLNRAERLIYASQTTRALREWEQGDFASARQTLAVSQPELRGWEYDYLHALFNRNQRTLHKHNAPVANVAFSPDGRRLAARSWNAEITVWDVQSGQQLYSISGLTSAIGGLGFSADGRRILAAAGLNLKTWDAETGNEQLTVTDRTGMIMCAMFSPDGQRIVTGSTNRAMGGLGPGQVVVWDATTGAELQSLKGHQERVAAVSFSPDGSSIISGSHDKTVKVWNAGSGELIRTLEGHTGLVAGLAVSPDGSRIASASAEVIIWDAESGAPLVTFPAEAQAVAFSPNGDRLVSGGLDKQVRLWSVETGNQITALVGHDQYITSVAFSSDGRHVASGSFDQTIKLWDAARDQQPLTLPCDEHGPNSLAISPDGRTAVTGGGPYTELGEAGDVKIWDIEAGRELRTLKDVGRLVAISPDGRRFASSPYGGPLKVFDVATGECTLSLGHHKWLHSLAFSPTGRHMVTGSYDSTLKVWDASTGQELRTIARHSTPVQCVTSSQDGTRIASGSGPWSNLSQSAGELRIFNTETGDELFHVQNPHGTIHCVAFSPDGRRVAAGTSDKLLRVWDIETAEVVVNCEGNTGFVGDVLFNPNGTRIVSSGAGGVRIWDAQSGRELLNLKEAAGVAAFTLDGRRLITGSSKGALIVWDARQPVP